MTVTTDDFLLHFGVKGMKWGQIRSKDEINSSDRSIKSGTTIQNISSRKLNDSNRHMFAAYTTYDKNQYADMMGNFMYDQKGYKNEFVVKKTIKIPSDKKLVETFTALVKADPQQVAKDMTRAYNDQHLFSTTVRSFEKKLSKLDPDDITSGEKLTKEMIASFSSSKSERIRADFFGSLIKQGYDGISDTNDRDNLVSGTQDPLIIFNPKKSLGPVSSVKLTKDDLQRYSDMTMRKPHTQSKKDLSEVQR